VKPSLVNTLATCSLVPYCSRCLAALLYYVLGVPFLGGWVNVAFVTLALLFTSLGLGFAISLICGK
jgi:hypothetical protein